MNELTVNNPKGTLARYANLDPFRDFKQIQEFAVAIAESDMASSFKKGTDGKVNPSDIIAAISIGIECGIPPISAVALGKTLNAKSYLSVLKGKSLGLDPITSITKVHNITTKNGEILYTSVDIISKTILDTNTTMKIIRDYEATPKYYEMMTNAYVGYHWKVFNNEGELNPLYFLYQKGKTSADELAKQLDGDKIVISKGSDITYVTSIHFIRKEKNIDEIFHYSTQEAIDAGLLMGYHSVYKLQDPTTKKYVAKLVEGKNNWNDNTPQMLRNRCISIPGRIIVADKLQGIYTQDEAMDIVNEPIIEVENIETIEVQEEN